MKLLLPLAFVIQCVVNVLLAIQLLHREPVAAPPEGLARHEAASLHRIDPPGLTEELHAAVRDAVRTVLAEEVRAANLLPASAGSTKAQAMDPQLQARQHMTYETMRASIDSAIAAGTWTSDHSQMLTGQLVLLSVEQQDALLTSIAQAVNNGQLRLKDGRLF